MIMRTSWLNSESLTLKTHSRLPGTLTHTYENDPEMAMYYVECYFLLLQRE